MRGDQVPRCGIGALDDIDLSTGRVVHPLGCGVKGPDYPSRQIHTYKSMEKDAFSVRTCWPGTASGRRHMVDVCDEEAVVEHRVARETHAGTPSAAAVGRVYVARVHAQPHAVERVHGHETLGHGIFFALVTVKAVSSG